jgi:hypothetical protein
MTRLKTAKPVMPVEGGLHAPQTQASQEPSRRMPLVQAPQGKRYRKAKASLQRETEDAQGRLGPWDNVT